MMKVEEIINRQKNILKKLTEELKEMDDVVEYVEAGEEEAFDSILVEHEDLGIANDVAAGQYFFIPIAFSESEVEQFVIMLTISDELNENKKVDMLQATAYLNYLLPGGAFVFDPSIEVLSFKRGLTFAVDTAEDDEITMIKYEIMNSLQTVAIFVAPLLAYLNDDVTWEEFVQACESLLTTSEVE